MDGVSGCQSGSAKNLHSNVWPAGTAKSGCKKTKNEWLSIGKGTLSSQLYKLVHFCCCCFESLVKKKSIPKQLGCKINRPRKKKEW